MSLVTMNRIWDHAHHSGTNLVVLLALADRADEDGICWPGVDWIAQRARLQPRQARNVLRSLECTGDLITINRKGGRHRTNLYIISAGLDDNEIANLLARRNDVEPTKPGNLASKTRQSSVKTRQSSVQNPAIAIADDPLYPPIEPPIDPPVVSAVTTAAAAAIPAPSDRNRQTDPEWASICTTYENEIGLLTPTIADELADLATDFPATWIVDALAACATSNVRKLKYAIAILNRWKSEGKNNHANRNAPAPVNAPRPAEPNIYDQLLGFATV